MSDAELRPSIAGDRASSSGEGVEEAGIEAGPPLVKDEAPDRTPEATREAEEDALLAKDSLSEVGAQVNVEDTPGRETPVETTSTPPGEEGVPIVPPHFPSYLLSCSPAYLLKWTGNEEPCRCVPLPTADSLRARIESNPAHGVDPGRDLFVVRGLPEDHLPCLAAGGVDKGFVAAHVARQPYRKRRRGMKGGSARPRFATFAYPEMLKEGFLLGPKREDDLLTLDPPMWEFRPLATRQVDGFAVAVCHASLWLGTANFLLLDWPVWKDPSVLTQKHVVHHGKSSARLADLGFDAGEQPDLEDGLYSALQHIDAHDEDGGSGVLIEALEDLAYDQWLDILDSLGPHVLTPMPGPAYNLCWHMMHSLEQNLETSRSIDRSKNGCPPDWAGLLARVDRRLRLTAPPTEKPTTTPPPAPFYPPPPTRLLTESTSSAEPPPPPSAADEAQRAVNRVSYLGGILLPTTLVSAILSMDADFLPGGPLFYVFWAVSVPLVLLATCVIYADTIRTAEVWVELLGDSDSDSDSKWGDAGSSVAGLKAVPWWRRGFRWLLGKAGWARRRGADDDEEEATGSSSRTSEADESVPGVRPPPPEPVPVPGQASDADGEVPEMQLPEFVVPMSFMKMKKKEKKRQAYAKQQLGWSGAVKAMVGVYKPLGDGYVAHEGK